MSLNLSFVSLSIFFIASYVVTYTAISNSGCSNTQYIPVIFSCGVDTTIVPAASPLPMPEADPIVILIDPNTNAPISQNCGPQEVNLSSPFSSAQTFLWEFGDGGTSTDKNPFYQYNTSGTYDLTHYAYHSNGDIDTMVITEFINQYVFDDQDHLDPEKRNFGEKRSKNGKHSNGTGCGGDCRNSCSLDLSDNFYGCIFWSKCDLVRRSLERLVALHESRGLWTIHGKCWLISICGLR